MDDLVASDAEDSRTRNLLGLRVDQHFHKPLCVSLRSYPPVLGVGSTFSSIFSR